MRRSHYTAVVDAVPVIKQAIANTALPKDVHAELVDDLLPRLEKAIVEYAGVLTATSPASFSNPLLQEMAASSVRVCCCFAWPLARNAQRSNAVLVFVLGRPTHTCATALYSPFPP